MSGRRQTDLCKSGKESTVNDPMLRSVNRNAKAGSPEDIYRHNPWRAPGNAPIADVCGLAGGTPWGANALEAGDYVNTTYAHHGTRGSTLPKMPTGTVWKIGGEATVSWNVRNNQCAPAPHLAPSRSRPLTACVLCLRSGGGVSAAPATEDSRRPLL